ncbi:hypothetical protein LCGC14_0923620 [marine sediment metagenome]|uniref:Uncharacterized protein n=1 Tax=marine sediment metagenome TaxID=412755 RepID=A0A0F9NQ57_9ZZZZ
MLHTSIGNKRKEDRPLQVGDKIIIHKGSMDVEILHKEFTIVKIGTIGKAKFLSLEPVGRGYSWVICQNEIERYHRVSN